MQVQPRVFAGLFPIMSATLLSLAAVATLLELLPQQHLADPTEDVDEWIRAIRGGEPAMSVAFPVRM